MLDDKFDAEAIRYIASSITSTKEIELVDLVKKIVTLENFLLIKEKKKQTGDLSAEEYAKIDGAKTILGKYYEEIKNREQYG